MKQRALWLIALLSLLLLSQTAAAADAGVLNTVVHKFKNASTLWAATINGYATWLFWTLATISLVWTFGFMAMRKADIGEFFAEFIRFCIFTGFFLWLLQNGPGYAMSIITSMMTIGSKAGGVELLNPSTPVDIAFDILDKSFKSLSKWHPIDSLAIVLVSLIILVCLATVAANVLLVLVTAWIMAYAGMFVLGFGGSRWTSDIALGYFRTIAGLAMKILTMTLLIGIATSLVNDHLAGIKNGASVDQLLVICVVALVLSMLIHTLPNMVAGLIPGGGGAAGAVGSFSAGQMAGAAKDTAQTATRMAGAAMSGGASMLGGMASAGQSMYSAFKGMSGSSGSSAGADLASHMSGLLGGGSSSGAGGGGGSPLGGAMGLASAASGMGGGGMGSALSSMAASGGQESGGGSNGSGGSAEGGSGGGSGGAAESGSEGGSGGSTGGGSAGSSAGASAGGGAGSSPGSTAGSAGAGSSAGQSQAASAGGQGTPGSAGTSSNGQTKVGAAGSSTASTSGKTASAGRTGQDIGATQSFGAGGKEPSAAGQATASQAAAQTVSSNAGNTRPNLDTSSSSRNFDPSAEVAAYRESKQENT